MARFFAQLFTPVFLVLTVIGLFAGTATSVSDGRAGGNLGDVVLHLTWERDVLDAVLLVACAYAGFVAARHTGRIVVTLVGLLLIALAVAGFVVGDDDAASKGFAAMHFPVAINVFDLIVGVLAFLSGLGTVEDVAPPTPRRI